MYPKIKAKIEQDSIVEITVESYHLILKKPIPVTEYSQAKKYLEYLYQWIEFNGVKSLDNIEENSCCHEVDINGITIKVERQNAKAMIEGFMKDSKRHYVSIFTASQKSKSLEKDFRKFPKLLENMIAKKPKKDYPLSLIGEKLNAESYEVPKKYVAVLDSIFHIKNEINLWQDICSNGLFDIWNPQAPYNSVKGKDKPMILLLRIFEIDDDLEKDIKAGGGPYYSPVTQKKVRLMKPVIPYNRVVSQCTGYDGELYFNEIIEKLENTLKFHGCWVKQDIVNRISDG